MALYPPILSSTQVPFLSSNENLVINYKNNSLNTESIGHIQVRIQKQSNNSNIIQNMSLSKDGKEGSFNGVYYMNTTSAAGSVEIPIGEEKVITAVQAGQLYKVQMRFGTNAIYTSDSGFSNWYNKQVFSDWSTVMIVKCIEEPVLSISQTDDDQFIGIYTLNASNKENIEQYQFTLSSSIGQQIETSGWLSLNNNNYSKDRNTTQVFHRFRTLLEAGKTYTVKFEIKTNNGYKLNQQQKFTITATDTDNQKASISFNQDNDEENGCITLVITTSYDSNNEESSLEFWHYIISRTSEKSNYTQYETLKYTPLINNKSQFLFKDFTVESGISYKYSVARIDGNGKRLAASFSESRSVDFEYSYLYRDGIQLKLMYNNSMNSFKHTTLRSKQDTIGSRYPYLLSNGNAYYAEFPITGLISLNMDIENPTFLEEKSDGFYYKDELIIPINRLNHIDIRAEDGHRKNCDPKTIKNKYVIPKYSKEQLEEQEQTAANLANISHTNALTDLTADNIYMERRFREKVEEFLNDFNYKLFKSPTEGNIVVGLMNVSLTPKQELGRMIYEFSATAYEVADNSLDSLKQCGIWEEE